MPVISTAIRTQAAKAHTVFAFQVCDTYSLFVTLAGRAVFYECPCVVFVSLCLYACLCKYAPAHFVFTHSCTQTRTVVTVSTKHFKLVGGAVFLSFISLFCHLTPCVVIYPHNFLPISSTIAFACSFVLDRCLFLQNNSQQSFLS